MNERTHAHRQRRRVSPYLEFWTDGRDAEGRRKDKKEREIHGFRRKVVQLKEKEDVIDKVPELTIEGDL